MRQVITACLVFLVPIFLLAGDFEDGVAAYRARVLKSAVRLFLRAAEQGNAEAQYKLGTLFGNGEGVAQDFVKAAKWWEKAAQQGNAGAQRGLGFMFYKIKEYKEAASLYQLAAEQDDAEAQSNLGTMYSEGTGVVQNHKEASKWWLRAANQGFASAQFNLGRMYYRGEVVLKDNSEAAKWFIKAANQGNAMAQFFLGTIYVRNQREQGRKGGPQDFLEGHIWLNLASSGGVAEAGNLRDAISKVMTPPQIEKAQNMALEKATEIEKQKVTQKAGQP